MLVCSPYTVLETSVPFTVYDRFKISYSRTARAVIMSAVLLSELSSGASSPGLLEGTSRDQCKINFGVVMGNARGIASTLECGANSVSADSWPRADLKIPCLCIDFGFDSSASLPHKSAEMAEELFILADDNLCRSNHVT